MKFPTLYQIRYFYLSLHYHWCEGTRVINNYKLKLAQR